MSAIVASGPYQDVVPGSLYPIAIQVKGESGTPFTGRTVKLYLDPADAEAAAARIEKTITSFEESTYGLADGMAREVLTTTNTEAMGASPGTWKVLWMIDGVALAPIRELIVTPMPKGDL